MGRNSRTYKKSILKRTAEIIWDILAFFGLITLLSGADRLATGAAHVFHIVYNFICTITQGT